MDDLSPKLIGKIEIFMSRFFDILKFPRILSLVDHFFLKSEYFIHFKNKNMHTCK